MLAALAFLTPLGRAREPDARSFSWFPLVGALLGAAVGGVWWGAGRAVGPGGGRHHRWWPPTWPSPAPSTSTAWPTRPTGVLPHLDRRRRLEVMAQPDVGAFGVATVVVTLVMRVTVLASMTPDVALVAAVVVRVPHADGGDRPGRPLRPAPRAAWPVRSWADAPARSPPSAAAVLVRRSGVVAIGRAWRGRRWWPWPWPAAAVVALARRRLGGFTGDVLGAAGVVGETVGLLVAATHW